MEFQEHVRKRKSNFSEDDTEFVGELVQKYSSVVNSKSTDKATNEQKEKVWNKITNEFNAASPSGRTRTKEELKNKYRNMKKSFKKEFAKDMEPTEEDFDKFFSARKRKRNLAPGTSFTVEEISGSTSESGDSEQLLNPLEAENTDWASVFVETSHKKRRSENLEAETELVQMKKENLQLEYQLLSEKLVLTQLKIAYYKSLTKPE